MATFSCLGPPVSLLLLALGVTWLGHVTDGARVLLVPLPDIGQCRQVVSIGRELQTRGHQVTLFVPDYFRVRRCTEPFPPGGAAADIEVLAFDTSADAAAADTVADKLQRLGDEAMRGGTGLLGGSRAARDVMRAVCGSYLEARDELDEVRRAGKVDMVLVDGSPAARCLALLPAYLGSPFAAVGSYVEPLDSGTPLPAAHYPAPLSALPGNMAFAQRLANLLYYALRAWDGELPWGGGFHQGSALGGRVSRLDHEKLIRKAVLYLENSDHIVDYPKATFPNFVQVGGLTAGPARPMPGPLGKFFDEAADSGVVVVSLGPHVFTPNKNLEDKLLAAFRKLDSRVLLRLNASRSVSRMKHVQTVSWFPQNDALGHRNTRVFVSLCGRNSFFEALHHGVPLLCCSFAGSDVLGIGARVAEYGVGLSLDLLTASSDSVVAAINTLLSDKSYTRRMRAASRLFHSRPESAVQRAASAVEHVLKYGGGYLRPRTVDMSFFQHAGLDVALALFSLVLALVVVVGCVVSKRLSARTCAKEEAHKVKEPAKNPAADAEKPAAVKKLSPEEQDTRSMVLTCVVLAFVVLFYIVV